MVVYFPKQFSKSGNRELNGLRINRIDAILDCVLDPGTKSDEKLYEAEKQILEVDAPNIWNVYHEGNMERVLEVDSRKFGIAVCENTNQDIEEITTFTFYASVEHLKEKFKKKQ